LFLFFSFFSSFAVIPERSHCWHGASCTRRARGPMICVAVSVLCPIVLILSSMFLSMYFSDFISCLTFC
jgi:hypothetical protein